MNTRNLDRYPITDTRTHVDVCEEPKCGQEKRRDRRKKERAQKR